MNLIVCAAECKVLFKNAATLPIELCEAKGYYSLSRLERNLAKSDLLSLNELSYLSFNRHQSEQLFKAISDRSKKSSTIVITNFLSSGWTGLFDNTTMIATLIDRLTYRSHVMDINNDSFRCINVIKIIFSMENNRLFIYFCKMFVDTISRFIFRLATNTPLTCANN